MRVSSVQYPLQQLESFDQFSNKVESYIRIGIDYDSEFIVFPEYFTAELLTLEEEPNDMNKLAGYAEKIEQLFIQLADKYNVSIVAGTYVRRKENGLHNTSVLYTPDGEMHKQDKLHLTPDEKRDWGMQPGEELNIIETPKGKVAILTCYDIEFPEIVRIARGKGADVIFCPANTDSFHGYQRVRHCAHARTVENQVYVVLSGLTGTLKTVDNLRMTYGQSAILTPSDVAFPDRGVITEGSPNEDTVVTADMDLDLLEDVRKNGTVTTWKDKRPNLYERLRAEEPAGVR